MSITFDPRPFDIETFDTIESQLKWIGFDGTAPTSLKDRIELTQRDFIVREHLDDEPSKPFTDGKMTVMERFDLDFVEYTWTKHGGWWLMKELLKWQKRIKSFGNNEAVLAAFAKHDKSGAISRMALASAKKAEQESRREAWREQLRWVSEATKKVLVQKRAQREQRERDRDISIPSSESQGGRFFG